MKSIMRGSSPISHFKLRAPRSPTVRTRYKNFRIYSTAVSDSEGPLKGVKILDLSRVLAGPTCTQILADYGADVIKVEHPGRGDDTRYWRAGGEGKIWKQKEGMSLYFAAVNRNKRSMTLNLKHEKGREILMELVKRADVVTENFIPGKLDELGIGYDRLIEANPKIILASISGYGSSGPFGRRAGYDMIAGAEAGILHITGEADGPPTKPGLGLTDMCTGLYMHGAIVSALYARDRTGRGQKLEASLFETQISLLTNVASVWLNMGQEAKRWGTEHPAVVPYGAFKTKDSYLVITATNPKQFKVLCEKLGDPELNRDPRFTSAELRVQNRDELKPIIDDLLQKRTTDEWLEILEGSGMPYGSVNNMQRVFEHPQTEARDMVETIDFEPAKSGKLALLGIPVKFSDTEPSIRQRPAQLGEHTEDVLAEIGITAEEVNELRKESVV